MYSDEEKEKAKDFGIELSDSEDLVINGQVIGAYTYLLVYYSDEKVKSFKDFDKIHEYSDLIIQRIINDLASERMRIQDSRYESRETAEADAKKVWQAVDSVVSFINKLSK